MNYWKRMKHSSLVITLVTASTLLLAGCWKSATPTPTTDTGAVVETGTNETGAVATGATDTGAAVVVDRVVSLDSKASNLEWFGKKVVGSHTGTVVISSGTLGLANNLPVSGIFTIDMTTITSNDGEKLVSHLKSEDFFNVSGFNESTLKLLKITPDTAPNTYTVVASLTIKGITNAITFPAVIEVTDTQVTASAKISIDRTKWEIKYGSASIFSDIGDKAIDDKIEYTVNVVLK